MLLNHESEEGDPGGDSEGKGGSQPEEPTGIILEVLGLSVEVGN